MAEICGSWAASHESSYVPHDKGRNGDARTCHGAGSLAELDCVVALERMQVELVVATARVHELDQSLYTAGALDALDHFNNAALHASQPANQAARQSASLSVSQPASYSVSRSGRQAGRRVHALLQEVFPTGGDRESLSRTLFQ
eukprot:358252-Chlamydomonas_euryale.AAC.1